jgi:hypothetical protein
MGAEELAGESCAGAGGFCVAEAAAVKPRTKNASRMTAKRLKIPPPHGAVSLLLDVAAE